MVSRLVQQGSMGIYGHLVYRERRRPGIALPGWEKQNSLVSVARVPLEASRLASKDKIGDIAYLHKGRAGSSHVIHQERKAMVVMK